MADDSDEDDADYVPPPDEDDEGAAGAPAAALEPSTMAPARKRKIDELWNEMNAASGAGPRAPVTSAAVGSKTGKTKAAKKSTKKAQGVLAGIFGKHQASQILGRSAASSAGAASATRNTTATLAKVPKKMVVTETVKFAGQSIEVKKTVTSTDGGTAAAAAAARAAKRPASALDSALSDIQGPKAMTTIIKSSIDWDNKKIEEGLEEELATAGQNGLLAKRDFLQRCDERQFDIEKTGREATRKRDAPNSRK